MPVPPSALQYDSYWISSSKSFASNATFDSNEGVYYNIFYEPGVENFDDGSSGYSVGHTSATADYIRSIFNRLDPLIDLDFVEKFDREGSLFDIYSLSEKTNWSDTTLGSCALRGGWFDIYWKDTGTRGLDSDNNDRNTIVHEIGHALGLSHPYDDGFYPGYNVEDTVMSYNSSPNGWSTWFTDSDILALQQIWGLEDDLSSVSQSPVAQSPATSFVDGYVYRLFNASSGAYLFSSNSNEIDIITGQGWTNEGAAYQSPSSGSADLHRFLIQGSGKHFYTANYDEKAILQTSPGYLYEGIAYQVYSSSDQSSSSVPVVRYLNTDTGSHIYSTSQIEQNIFSQTSSMINEGVAWYGESI